MTATPHPLRAVAALAAERTDLRLVTENDGAYIRIICDSPALIFKHKADPRDSLDRTDFSGHKRIVLEEDDFANGPAATLQTILSYLKHYEGRDLHAPTAKPLTGGKS
ncbi:MAG: acetyl-CoA acetyltransferase [Alphaproteobacteria bacterium]|jgi:hypothetical protein|nr:acetyl-CoA acetyltransferase [Paracoccaceae bacterium]